MFLISSHAPFKKTHTHTDINTGVATPAHANIIIAIRERNSKCQNTQKKIIGIIKTCKS